MKVAVIGNGHVGKTVFRELQEFREIHQLVLVGRDVAACKAEAEDYLDTVPLRFDMVANIDGGGYELAQDADILVYTAGPSLDSKCDRLAIADANVAVAKEVFAEVDKYAPNAMVIVVTNPLDVMTTVIQKLTGRPENRVIGTGTLLDTARMIKIVSWVFNVSPNNVTGFVLGEHGNSSVSVLSGLQVMGIHHERYLEDCCNGVIPINGKKLTQDVRDAGINIFRGKGYTSAGVAACVARLVSAIVNDRREILPVSTVLHGEYGVDGFAMSVPCMVGAEGIMDVKKITLSYQEHEDLAASAAAIKATCESVGFC